MRDTGHIFVEVCELLDLLFDRWVAVRIFRYVQFVYLCLQPMELIERALDLLAS